MATEIVTIQGVETKTGVSQKGNQWTLYKVQLGDGRLLSTFDHTPGKAAQSAIGERREVDISEKARDGRPPDLMLDAIRPAPTTAASVQAGGSEPVPAQVWADKDRRIAREVCIKAVVDLYAHRDVAIPKTEDLLKRAAEFEAFIYRGMEDPAVEEEDEFADVPFE